MLFPARREYGASSDARDALSKLCDRRVSICPLKGSATLVPKSPEYSSICSTSLSTSPCSLVQELRSSPFRAFWFSRTVPFSRLHVSLALTLSVRRLSWTFEIHASRCGPWLPCPLLFLSRVVVVELIFPPTSFPAAQWPPSATLSICLITRRHTMIPARARSPP